MASITAFAVLLVVGVRSLGRLRHRHLVPVILEDVSNGFFQPEPSANAQHANQDHVLNMLCHDHFSFAAGVHSGRLIFDVESIVPNRLAGRLVN